MKKLLVLLFSFFLLFASPIKAETWSCSYLYNGEARNVVWVRQGNTFYSPTTKATSKIIFEDDSIISLHKTYSPQSLDYFATLIDKTKNMFAKVLLEIDSNSKIIEGKCNVY